MNNVQERNGRQIVMPQVQGQLVPAQQQLATVQVEQFLVPAQIVPVIRDIVEADTQMVKDVAALDSSFLAELEIEITEVVRYGT